METCDRVRRAAHFATSVVFIAFINSVLNLTLRQHGWLFLSCLPSILVSTGKRKLSCLYLFPLIFIEIITSVSSHQKGHAKLAPIIRQQLGRVTEISGRWENNASDASVLQKSNRSSVSTSLDSNKNIFISSLLWMHVENSFLLEVFPPPPPQHTHRSFLDQKYVKKMTGLRTFI